MKLTFVELNEFNKQLLKTCAELFDLKSVKKLVSMQESETYTDDTYESDYLEPWVQWVCVHTGSLSKHHGIKHLGDVPCLTTPQIWEKLSSMGYSSIIWGAMNADRKESDKNLVFLPDPWTSNERAFPEELNKLLDPLRAVSTNYLKPDKVKIMKMMKSLMGLFKDKELLKELIFELPSLLKELITFKKAHFVFIAFTEYFSTKLFLKYKKQLNPDFSLILCMVFLNNLHRN